MIPVLIVFVDGVPHDEISALCRLREHLAFRPFQTGLGYSVNIYHQLFSGLTPDEVGFFNVYRPRANLDRTGNYYNLEVLDRIRRYPLASVLAHKVVDKFVKRTTGNIPFHSLGHFEKFYWDAMIPPFVETSILHPRFGIKVVGKWHRRFRTISFKDSPIIPEFFYFLRKHRRMLCYLLGPDHVAHKHPMDSEHYSCQLTKTDKLVSLLVKSFLDCWGESSEVIVLSDHGMAPVGKSVSLVLESLFGKPSPRRYIYFLDSVMCRFWARDRTLRDEIGSYLDSLRVGTRLTSNMRRSYGVTNPVFGDEIFVLEEGFFFVPNFFGWRPMKSMHGYLPELESQLGIVGVRSKEILSEQNGERRLGVNGVHNILKRALSNGDT